MVTQINTTTKKWSAQNTDTYYHLFYANKPSEVNGPMIDAVEVRPLII